MLKQHSILVVLWIMFSFFHSALASETLKVKVKIFMGKKYKYYRILYSAFAFLSLVAVIVYHFSINSYLLWNVFLIEKIISVALMIAGFSIMILFTKKFFFELSGADIFLKKQKTATLINTSLYNYVRHPLYSATLVFVWGIFFLQPLLSNLISCICITVYTVIGIGFEEKKLISEFGNPYLQYKAKTPMLIPTFRKPH